MAAGEGPKEFEHESLQESQSAVNYLRAITEGLESGRLVLRSGDEEDKHMVLSPKGLISFLVRARRKDKRVQLTMKLEWRDDIKSISDNGRLVISSGEQHPDPEQQQRR